MSLASGHRGTGDIDGLEFNPCDSNVYAFARTSPY